MPSLALLRSEPVAVSPPLLARPVVVMKFGSSVLSGPADAPAVASDIYAEVRRGRRVVAVVSAFAGETDRLLAEARALGLAHDNPLLPAYVVQGEERSAALAAIACDRIGLSATTLSVRDLGIIADGPAEHARPIALDHSALDLALEQHEVVVVPGFGALSPEGEIVLMGRGGSDLTALFLAAELGLDHVQLVKDVDGLYDRDPNVEPDARRYDRASWAVAKALGGGALARLLGDRRFEVVGVLVRDPAKPRDVPGVSAAVLAPLLVADPSALLDLGPDILLEALSEAEAGHALIRAALQCGVDVASANKQAVSREPAGLLALAEAHDAKLLWSASIGGGVPMVETLRATGSAGPVLAFEAVLNGTVNFMLERLGGGASFDVALAEARAAGFAEEDPSSDLEGLDAAAKVRLLAFEAFGRMPDEADIPRDILSAASLPPAGVRQLCSCHMDNGRLVAEVRLVAGPLDPVFTALKGEGNALKVIAADGSVVRCRGRGAGRWATAESLLADLSDLAARRFALRAA